MELQEAWQKLHKSRVAVFDISYDSVDVLATFAEKRGITFQLLSDAGSHTIRAQLSPLLKVWCQYCGRQ